MRSRKSISTGGVREDPRRFRVLLIERGTRRAHHLTRILREQVAAEFEVVHLRDLREALDHLRNDSPDAILLDLSWPDESPLAVFARVHVLARGVPVIVIGPSREEDMLLRAVRQGALDHLLLDEVHPTVVSRTIRYAIQRYQGESPSGTPRDARPEEGGARLEAARRESEERFRQIAENIREIFWLFDVGFSRTIYVSPAYEEIWGRPAEAVYEHPRSFLADVHPEDLARVASALDRISAGEVVSVEYRVSHPERPVRWVRSRGFPVRDERGEVYRVVGTTEDITERKEAEAKLAAAEAHYRRLVESAPQGIYALDARGCFIELNPAGERLLGRPAREVMGEHFSTVIAPADRGVAESAFDRVVSGAEYTTDLEERIVRPSGEERLLHVTETAIHEGGAIVGTHGIARDITDERARQREMRLLTTALESLDDAVSIADSRGRLVYSNAAHARLLGYDPAAGPPGGIDGFCVGDAESELAEVLDTLAERGSWAGRVHRRRVDDGRVVPFEVIRGRVDRENGGSLIFNIARDVTKEVERERRLRRAERLASVGTLVAGVAHELNNPLHAVRNFAELMLMDAREPEDRESLSIMKREADRAAKIVSDLRMLARDTQRGTSSREAVDLNDIVRHVLRVRQYALETANVEVREDLAENLSPVLANPGEIEQVVLNLVVNAEQAMNEQSGRRQLILRTRRTAQGAAVSIVDSGPGLPPEYLDRIFDPFFSTKAPGEGTGLGLSLVHSIVMEHGGEIHVESEPGKGAAFRVDLPLAAGAEEDEEPEADPSAPLAASRPLRILVVDDEEVIRRVSVRFLARLGHTVDTAAEGEEALRLLEAEEYDVILCDLRMPGLGGEELLRRLREEGEGMERRLIFMTGDAASVRSARAVAEADVPVLVKPVPLADLARAVDRVGQGRAAGPGWGGEASVEEEGEG